MMRRHLVALAACLTFTSACAEKAFTPPSSALSPTLTLQLVTTASTPTAGASWVLIAALFRSEDNRNGNNNGDDFDVLAYKFFPLTLGTQSLTLPVNISPCLAANASKGKDGCSMYLAAVLLADTMSVSDSTRDPISEAFDAAFPLGPFEVAPGRSPTIPPIDLSATRFGAVGWVGDDALRLGGNAPSNLVNIIGQSGPAVSGVASATGAPTLFTLSRGFQVLNANTGQAQQVPQLAIFQNGTWRRVDGSFATPIQGTNDYNDVTALATNEVYMSSTTGLYKYDGTSIARIGAITDTLYSVASVNTSATNKYVIAGGLNGSVWIGNTQTWQRYSLGAPARIDGVCITGPSEAFASTVSGSVWRFNGTTWISVQPPLNGPKLELQCPAPGQAFVLNSIGTLYKWNGTAWATMPSPALSGRGQFHWGVVSASEIYAYADSAGTDRAFYRFDGTSWCTCSRLRYTLGGGRPWAVPGGGAAYVVSQLGRLERITPSGASVVSYQPSLRDVIVNSATSAFVVGWQSFLARWNGTQWNVDAPPANSPANRNMTGVWSDAASNAWAVGDLSTVLRWGGASWGLVSDSLRPAGARDNYNAVWGVGADVWAVGDNTILHCKSVTSCTNESSGGSGALLSVWGSSATNVFAVGDGGRIARFNGTAWTSMASPTSRALARISGSGASDVWAVGDSVLIHFDGTQWTSIPMTGELTFLQSHVPTPAQRAGTGGIRGVFSLGLWVRGPREVYVANQYGNVFRYDGKSWNEINGQSFRRWTTGISGAAGAGGCALAVTESQSDASRATLWRGVGPTGCFSSPMAPPTSWP